MFNQLFAIGHAAGTPRSLASSNGSRYSRGMTDAPAEPIIHDNPERHRFEADLGDGSFAVIEYKLVPGKIVLIHTEVPPAHEGQGIASALIRFALSWARERGLKVIPLCPFVAAYIRRHPEVQDLLDPPYFRKLGLE